MRESRALTLEEAAVRLGLHYMTVYRYVRTGRLPAEQRDGRWQIRPEDLSLVAGPAGRRQPRQEGGERKSKSLSGAVDRMVDRLLAGDSSGAWSIVDSALLAGSPQDVHLQILGPALRSIGDKWETGRITVADEHRATAVALGLLGRLGPLFARPGRRRRGSVLLAGAETDPHAIPILMVGDVLRSEGFEVIQLGADVPVDHLVAMAFRAELLAVGVSVSTDGGLIHAERAVSRLHEHLPGVGVFLGGPAVGSEETARASGADGWAADAGSAAELVLRLAGGRTSEA